MTGENGIPETPDWTPTPRPDPLQPRMSGLEIPEWIELGEN